MDITVATGAPTMLYPYAYVEPPMNVCTRASVYTGVKFKISGAQHVLQDRALDGRQAALDDENKGSCPNGRQPLPVAKIFAGTMDVTVLFADLAGSGVGGATSAPPPVTPSEVLNVQWQVNVPAAVAPEA